MTQPSADFLDLQTALAGEYSLQRELGRGAMGIVYLARDVQLDRDVARLLGEDVSRLAAAKREVDSVAPPRIPGARRIATPA